MIAFDPAWLGTGGLAILAGGGFWGWMRERQKTRASPPADMVQAYAAAALSLSGQGQNLIATLESQIARLGERIEALEEENDKCRSENWQLRQAVGSLERRLIAAGIPLKPEELPDTIIEFEDGHALVVDPRKRP